MRAALIITFILASLASPAGAKSLTSESLGLPVAKGSGHVNGQPMDVVVISGPSFDELKRQAKKQFLVREVSDKGQRTLLIVADSPYVFSTLTMPDGAGSLIIGTPLVPLARGLRLGPSSYRGTALASLPDTARLDVETGFSFGQATVDTSTLTVASSPVLARSQFVTSLAQAGFKAEGTPSESWEAGAPLLFRKDKTVVSLIVNAGESGSEAKVMLHEVTVP